MSENEENQERQLVTMLQSASTFEQFQAFIDKYHKFSRQVSKRLGSPKPNLSTSEEWPTYFDMLPHECSFPYSPTQRILILDRFFSREEVLAALEYLALRLRADPRQSNGTFTWMVLYFWAMGLLTLLRGQGNYEITETVIRHFPAMGRKEELFSMLLDVVRQQPCCFSLLEVVNFASDSGPARRKLMEMGFLQDPAKVFRRFVEGLNATQLELSLARQNTTLLLLSRFLGHLARPIGANSFLWVTAKNKMKAGHTQKSGSTEDCSRVLAIPSSPAEYQKLIDHELHMQLRTLGFVETSLRLLSTKRLAKNICGDLLRFSGCIAKADEEWAKKKLSGRNTSNLLIQNWNILIGDFQTDGLQTRERDDLMATLDSIAKNCSQIGIASADMIKFRELHRKELKDAACHYH